MKGFTLIETLVAIAIMMLAIAGPLTIAHKGVQAALYAKDQVTAYYLAQDAMEYVRSVRDSNFIASQSSGGGATLWLAGLDPTCIGANGCQVDTVTPSIATCPISGCTPLNYDAASGRYTQTAGQGVPSIFTRTIHLDTSITNNVIVKVKITWDTGLFTKSFEVKENLMNFFATGN